MTLAPVLSPHGVLSLKPSPETEAADSGSSAALAQAFARGPGHGLLHLGADLLGAGLPPLLSYWREFATRYVGAVCALPDAGEGRKKPDVAIPVEEELSRLV